MTKRDKILILILIIIALTSYTAIHLWGMGQQGKTAEIFADGKLVQHIDLQNVTRQKEFSVQGPLGKTVVQVQNGKARIVSSPCPDKICVRMGWVKMPGQSAICIPNQVLLRINSKNDKVDSISR